MRFPHLTRALAPALALLAAGPSHAATYVYSAVLNPRQEVPPVASSALGGGRFLIDTDANEVSYWISCGGLSSAELSAHIHGAAAGVNGGVLHTLPAGNPKIGVWNYDESQEASILAGQTYANVHTSTNSGGEIRGQIVPFNALLGASQAVPVNGSAGSGWAIATVDTAANQISYRIVYEGLTGAVTLSHFHGNALYGANAGVKVTIPVSTSPMTGTLSYNTNDEAALLTGRWYINLHTSANPGGEIRGQLVPRVEPMDGLQAAIVVGGPAARATPTAVRGPGAFAQLPPPPETSAGLALVAMDTVANVLGYDVRVVSLSAAETAAHIHGFADYGGAAPPLATLPAGNQKLGTWSYGAGSEESVLRGHSYVNVHTSAFPDGEIRGQIAFPPGFENLVGVVGGGPRVGPVLLAAPNPSAGRTALTMRLARGGRATLAIVGVDGRRVRELARGTFAPGPHTFEWDGRDDAGRPVAPGVFFAVGRGPEGVRVLRLVRLR